MADPAPSSLPSDIARLAPPRPVAVRAPFELLLFATSPALVRDADAAGIDGFLVDWERRGKHRRQAGEGTQINGDTLADLRVVRRSTERPVLCRLNGFGPWTGREVERAVRAGADEVLLPMVRTVQEVDRTLDLVHGRTGVGILVETQQSLRSVPALAARPLTRIYLGLNDLRIDRGSDRLFAPLVDGTAEEVVRGIRVGRTADAAPSFGVAGLTLPDRGDPVPSTLLAAELDRLGAGFTFLRRSFLADTGGHDLDAAVAAIRGDLDRQRRRSPARVDGDRRDLVERVSGQSRRSA